MRRWSNRGSHSWSKVNIWASAWGSRLYVTPRGTTDPTLPPLPTGPSRPSGAKPVWDSRSLQLATRTKSWAIYAGTWAG